MPSHNLYSGYVKLPGKSLYETEIRLDFNVEFDSESADTRVRSYNLRLFTLSSIKNIGKGTEPEMSVSLTAEQWIDLIESMKEELDKADDIRKTFEDINDDE